MTRTPSAASEKLARIGERSGSPVFFIFFWFRGRREGEQFARRRRHRKTNLASLSVALWKCRFVSWDGERKKATRALRRRLEKTRASECVPERGKSQKKAKPFEKKRQNVVGVDVDESIVVVVNFFFLFFPLLSKRVRAHSLFLSFRVGRKRRARSPRRSLTFPRSLFICATGKAPRSDARRMEGGHE